MGARGPAPTPIEFLERRGSNRVGRHASVGLRPPVELAPPPSWLSDEAQQLYDALGARLLAVGLVTALDTETLACLAMAWADLRTAQEFLAKHGMVYVARARPRPGQKEGAPIGLRAYPHAKIARELRAEILRLGDRLGLSPAARARLDLKLPQVPSGKPRPWLDAYASPARGLPPGAQPRTS